MERIADMNDKFNKYLKKFQLKSDEELFLLIKEDVQTAYFEIVERWSTKLHYKAYKRIQDKSVAMILVKQVLAELWDSRDKLSIKKISDYLISSLKYKLYVLHEKNELANPFSAPSDSALNIGQIKQLIEEWLCIQPEERVHIFNLKYKARMTSKEISEKLHIRLSAVSEQLTASRVSLNDYVQKFIDMDLG
jgi:DNA-directed RNA polymerase specialized sigma24 family protein